MNKVFALLASLLLMASCGGNKTNLPSTSNDTLQQKKVVKQKPITEFEKECIAAGLTDVHTLDTNIVVELKYSTTNNFMHKDMYGDFDKAYLQKDVAGKLVNAQKYLSEVKPGYRLIIYDAVRQRRVQQLMWDSTKLLFAEKIRFLSNPKYGSLHNYGAAVDLSIVDNKGKAMDMGTAFDYAGTLAAPDSETKMLNEGKLTQQQIDNRKLLRKVMYKAGFFNIQSEWWHFNACTLPEAEKKYGILE
jgi:zinc D-Ala-D-Ala dipeptidase